MRGRQGVPPGRGRLAGGQPRRSRRRVSQGGAGGARQRELQDRAAARDDRRVPIASRQGARLRAEGSARGGARRVPSGERVRSQQSAGDRQGGRARSNDPPARRGGAPAVTTPLPRIRYNNTSLKDVLNSIADVTGINITYDREVTDRQITVQLDGATLEQALNQIMTMNQLSYKVINERSIFVFPDTPPKHAQYDEQVVRTFYVSHADATELTQILSTIIRLPGIAVQPAIVANKTSNTITVRATSSVVQIIERIIQQNDKPRAEIVIDVEILEVDRSRAKDYGLNLTDYAVGAIFSPEVSPSGTTTQTTTATPGATGGVTAGVGTAGGTTGGTTSTNTGR
ncbi:MAG: hypothetical protein DMG03_04105 [Acidobacteria bacterium]|nr:MAG: hypothetical protein DMG03_04105 [Acidobacteriota bacterium]